MEAPVTSTHCFKVSRQPGGGDNRHGNTKTNVDIGTLKVASFLQHWPAHVRNEKHGGSGLLVLSWCPSRGCGGATLAANCGTGALLVDGGV